MMKIILTWNNVVCNYYDRNDMVKIPQINIIATISTGNNVIYNNYGKNIRWVKLIMLKIR